MHWKPILVIFKNENNAKWRSSPIYKLLVMAIAAVVGFWSSFGMSEKPFSDFFSVIEGKSVAIHNVSLNDLEAEFRKVLPFPGSASYGEKITDRYHVKSISNSYYAAMSAEKVGAYYRTQLRDKGWAFRRTYSGGEHWGETYCKGRIVGSIDFISLQKPTEIEYAFSAAIRRNSSECQ